MACQVLEVTLISAKDLKRVTFFSKMRVYAVASISGAGDPRLPTHRTYADREGGRNPVWHAPLRFTIPAADPRKLALHVLLRAERRAFGDRDVGEVFVPVRDLAAAAAAAPGGGGQQQQRHLSYQVRRPVSGRKRGVLHISYRLTDVVPTAASSVAVSPYVVHRYVHEAAERRSPYRQHHGGSPYAYGQQGAAAAARHDGAGTTGAGVGLSLLGGAAAGLMLGDMVADAKVMDGVGF